MSATVSIIKDNPTYSMVSAPMWMQVNSASSSAIDFNYIFDVTTFSPTNSNATQSYLGRFKAPPRPLTGDGLFTPNKILKSEISYDFNPFLSYQAYATNSIVEYAVAYGSQYNPEYQLIGSTFRISPPFVGKVVIFASTNSSPSLSSLLQVNDIIQINVDNIQQFGYLNGTTSVVGTSSVFGFPVFIIDKDVQSGTFSATGDINNLLRIDGTTTKKYGLNGTRQYKQVDTNFGNQYIQRQNSMASANDLIPYLSNYRADGNLGLPNSNGIFKPVYLTNYETTSYLVDKTMGITYTSFIIQTQDSAGNNISSFTFSANLLSSNFKRVDYASGPMNLAALGVSFTGVSQYLMLLVGPSGIFGTLYSVKAFQIIANCSPWNNIRIAFLNRLGGIDYYNFNWKSQKTSTIERTQYKKVLDWNYKIGARQDTIIGQKVNETYIANTDFLSEYDAAWLEELVESPEVYVVDETNLQLLPIVLTDSQFLLKTKLKDKLFSLQIAFRYAFDINTQSL